MWFTLAGTCHSLLTVICGEEVQIGNCRDRRTGWDQLRPYGQKGLPMLMTIGGSDPGERRAGETSTRV